MKEIELTQGQVAIVDDIDFEYLNQWKWHAHFSSYTNSYYAVRTSKSINLSRTIMERMLGRELVKGEQVDHINHDTLDNRRENLRLVTISQNQMNRGVQKNNTSGYKGVFRHNSSHKWRAQIVINRKTIHLGVFDSPEDAYEAYCKAADELHGEFANYGY